jgi:phytoene dehydrogenase-like protein
MANSITIIGGGIAGLAAGCYAQMNGYRSTIFEMHTLPGGLCTAWDRQGYIFDGCIHYLLGTAPGQPYHRIWQELGALRDRNVINHDELIRIIGSDGRTLIAASDADRLEQNMKELSPADSGLIEGFVGGVRQFADFDMSVLQQKPKAMMGVFDWARLGLTMLPFAPGLLKYGFVSAEAFAQRFRDPFLRRAFPLMFFWPEIPVMAGMMLLGAMQARNAGFPAGASLDFARAIERRYLELGGEIRYNAQVEKILVDNNRAIGVRLYNDEVHRADIVISAADGHATIFDMLGGEYVNRTIKGYYDGHMLHWPQVQVSLGVARDMSREPHWAFHLLEAPVTIAGEDRREISVKHYDFDPSLAPPGRSAVEVMFRSNYDYWQNIYGHRLYDAEQQEVSEQVIEQLERLYPGINGQIEVVDVATPISAERYTGNWNGSGCGWLLTDRTVLSMLVGIKKTLPGLESFYMAGQWVEPGGMVPVVAMSGRNVIQLICHADHTPFVTRVD